MIGTCPATGPVVAGDAVRLGERRRLDLGQHLPRNAEERQQLVVPVQRLQIHQHGPAGVGHVGDVHAAARPAGEIPQHPGVGGAEDRVALLGVGAHAVDVLQNPLHLACGEVGGGRQPGLAPDDVAAAVAVQRRGDAVGAGVLPDDRVVIRPAGAPVPYQRGFPLVGDAQRGQVGGRQLCLVQRRHDHRRGSFPDLDGIVLDPAGLGQDLFVLELVAPDLGAVVVEDHAPRAGGALVDGGDELGQLLLPS